MISNPYRKFLNTKKIRRTVLNGSQNPWFFYLVLFSQHLIKQYLYKVTELSIKYTYNLVVKRHKSF